MKYYYELTGNRGKTLFDSLAERHFQDQIAAQAEAYIKDAVRGGDWREGFVNECLWDELNGSDMDEIVALNPDLQGKCNEEIKRWLLENKCPVADEENLIEKWAWRRADLDAQDGGLWDQDGDDIRTALDFGLVKYPPFIEGKYVDSGSNCIPADTANEIRRLTDEANKIASDYHVICGTDQSKDTEEQKEKGAIVDDLRYLAVKLEREAVGKHIMVTGFYCDIHGGRAEFDRPIPKGEVLTCPSCGHPICPVCANAFSEDPQTEEKAREYLKSCDTVSGHAWCGHCGDYSEEFMLRFLKLKNCPIPLEYQVGKPAPRQAQFYMTASVSKLPGVNEIVKTVAEKFSQGASGIITVEHSTGEIWGIPEKHPEGWIVTICYPSER